MAHRPKRTIDRRTVARISRLELRARTAVEGYYSGIHKSPYHGLNVEFAEYREYSPGDDLRYLDWRVLARSDRYFIKQFDTETNLNCYLLVDCSGSMDYTSGKTTRLDYATSVAAAMGLLMLRQGDAVGLVTFDNAVRQFIPPRGNARHFSAIWEALENVVPGKDTNLPTVLHDIAERVHRRSMIVIISDFFDNLDEVMNGLQHFRHRNHEVLAFHVVDDAEIEFPFDRVTLFEGMERNEEIIVDPRVIAQGYRLRFRKFMDEIRRGCVQKGIDYELMRMSTPFDKALTSFLARRR